MFDSSPISKPTSLVSETFRERCSLEMMSSVDPGRCLFDLLFLFYFAQDQHRTLRVGCRKTAESVGIHSVSDR